MKYIAYCRKSTDEKDRQVLSIEAQIAELKEYAQREHLEIVDFITESKTAKEPGRGKFNELLNLIEKGRANGIVSWHPDRLARNSIDGGKIIYLIDTGKLVSLKFPSFWFENTPQGKFMLSIAFGQSKYYVDNLSENVKRGIRQKLRNGVWPGKAPLGYYNDLKVHSICIDPVNSRIVKAAFELFVSGNKSFTDIARFLFSKGIKRKTGTIPHINQIRNILANKFYVGIFYHNGEIYEGTHKCFISKDLFRRAQERLKKLDRPRNKGHNFPFVGIARCKECGGAVTAEIHRKFYKSTNRHADYIYYRCTKKFGQCSQKYISENNFEKQLRKIILDSSLPLSWERNWRKRLADVEIDEQKSALTKITQLKEDYSEVNTKLNLLLDSFLDRTIEAEIYKSKKNELMEKRMRIQEKIGEIEKNGSSWLEPMRNFMDSALQAQKSARAKDNNQELGIIGKTVGSNFFLENRRLSVSLRQPFAMLCAPPPAQSLHTRSNADSPVCRARWSRTTIKGFGDLYSAIELWPYRP
ncbi:MAG: Recombinase [Candidatus Gottesmanbacteria bacterium GW2011_GWC2_42_8]|nr:MAG: Recombinase [Candidatus Gottesmanbacteria bacterium GW2011_GWC2_42_8]